MLRESGNLYIFDNQDTQSLDSYRGCISISGAGIEILSESELAKEDIRFRKHVLRVKTIENSVNPKACTMFLSIEQLEILTEWIGAFLVVSESSNALSTTIANSDALEKVPSETEIHPAEEEATSHVPFLRSASSNSHQSEIYDLDDNYPFEEEALTVLPSGSPQSSQKPVADIRRIPLHKTITGHASGGHQKREFSVVVGSKDNGRIELINALMGLDFFPLNDETLLPLCISHRQGQKEPLLYLPSQLHMTLNMIISILGRILQERDRAKEGTDENWDPPLSRDCTTLVSQIRAHNIAGFHGKEIGKLRVMETLKLSSNLLKLIRHPKIMSSISSREASVLSSSQTIPATTTSDVSLSIFSSISEPTQIPELMIEFHTPKIPLFFGDTPSQTSANSSLRSLISCPDPSDTDSPQVYSEMLARLITWDVSTRVAYVTAATNWSSRSERRLRKLLKTTVNRHDKSQRERVYLVLMSGDGVQIPIEDLQKSRFFPQHRVLNVCARMGWSAINMQSKGLQHHIRGSKWFHSIVREGWFRDFIRFAFCSNSTTQETQSGDPNQRSHLVELDDELEQHMDRLMDTPKHLLETLCTTVFKRSTISEAFSRLLLP